MRSTRRGRLLLWVVDRIPDPVLAAPERVLLAFVSVLIALTAVAPPPGSILERWSWPSLVGWAAIMCFGGGASLLCLWTLARRQERFGAVALAVGWGIYGGAVWNAFGTARLFTVLVFSAVALAWIVRWLRSTAYADYILVHRAAHRQEQQPGAD